MGTRFATLAGTGLLLFTASTHAHHAFAAEFDANKPIKGDGDRNAGSSGPIHTRGFTSMSRTRAARA